jgi:putative addiction module killer protein
MKYKISVRVLEFWSKWRGYRPEILEMFKPVGEGVSELRIDYGSGYRVYYKEQGQRLIILLAGGDKHSQARDIKTALRLARNL